MSYQPNRLRRPASPKKLQALRLAGWRYSSKRSAWVHRAFNGRVGPVFVDPADDHPRIAESIVIDHQGPRRGWEAPSSDHAIELHVVAAAYAPLDEDILIEVPAAAVVEPADIVAPVPSAGPAPVAEAEAAPVTAPAAAHVEDLPRRPLDRHRPELARLPLPPRPLDLAPAPTEREEIRVHVQLSESEEPRVVRVDGRPPRLDADADVVKDGVVVPFKAARAFG